YVCPPALTSDLRGDAEQAFLFVVRVRLGDAALGVDKAHASRAKSGCVPHCLLRFVALAHSLDEMEREIEGGRRTRRPENLHADFWQTRGEDPSFRFESLKRREETQRIAFLETVNLHDVA